MNSDADRIIGLYQRHARAWAHDRGNRLLERAWLDRFRGLLPAGASVLDIGCGSGQPIARYLVEQGCSVSGVDTSSELIALCAASFPDTCVARRGHANAFARAALRRHPGLG